MVQKEKLWTSDFVALMCVNFLTALVYNLIAVKIVEYTMTTFGASHSLAGSMVSSYILAAIFARIVFGSKIDEWGFKRAIILGASLILLASGLYLINLGMGFLYFARIVHGVGFGIETGALAASAALMVPASRRGEGIGYFSLSQAFAMGVGPMVSMLLMNAGASYFFVFMLAFTMSIFAIISAFIAKVPQVNSVSKANEKNRRNPRQRGFSIRRVISVEVLPICSVLVLVVMGYSTVVSFLTLFAEERNISATASIYFAVYSAVVLLTRPPMGRRLDLKGENSVTYLTLTAVVAGMVVLAFSFNGITLLLSASLLGVGVGATQSTIQATVAKLVSTEELGKANSTYFVCMDLGLGAGPVLMGFVIPELGYQASFLILAVVALIAVGSYHLFHGRKQ